jgi:hypothetical protein
VNTEESLDHTKFFKGQYGVKHKSGGLTPSQVAEIDPAWLVWAYQNWAPPPCSRLLYEECLRDVAENRQSIRVARDQEE